jgi:ABC-2 type transport system permease protein
MMRIIYGFIVKEMRQSLRDPRMRVLLFVVPCIQLTLFGVALNTETRNVRLATSSSAADPILDEIRQHALASGWFVDAARDGAGDPYGEIRGGNADAVLVPPAGGLTHAMGRNRGELQLLIDATNVTRAVGIYSYLSAMVLRATAAQTPSALNMEVRVLYNPSLTSAVYMVPGVMSVITCIVTILLTSMSIAREREIGTFESIIAAPVPASAVILGKTIPYILIGMSNIPLILAVAVLVFSVPMRGSLLLLLAMSLVFVCATVTIGILISTVSRTQQQAMLGGFIYMMPSILTSGLLSPVASMPVPLQVLAYGNPITYYMDSLRNIMLKGGDSQLLQNNLAVMLLMTLVLGMVSSKRFKTTL